MQGLAETVAPPYIVVTMKALWHLSKDILGGKNLAHVHFVTSLELDHLNTVVEQLPAAASIIGIGGGTAMDVAKFMAWRLKESMCFPFGGH